LTKKEKEIEATMQARRVM